MQADGTRWLFAVLACAIPGSHRGPWITQAASVQPFNYHVPRVTLEELTANKTLRNGHDAYVLVDYVGKHWKAMNWTLGSLKKKIPFEWVDYYPDNMMNLGNKPYLMKVSQAIPKFREPHPNPTYMHFRLSLRGWKKLQKDLQPAAAPDLFWDDESWIYKCMVDDDGKPDVGAIDNFYTTMQWKFLLVGEKGTSMFFHNDKSPSSSFSTQIIGSKSYTVCPNSQAHLLNVEINTYNPDYKRFPGFAKAHCGQVTLMPGDMLYYPGYMWHHSMNHETPTVSYVGALVGTEQWGRTDLGRDRVAHKRFLEDMRRDCGKCWKKGNPKRLCDDISVKWPGAAPPMMRKMCDEYLPRCFKLWDEHAKSLSKPRKLQDGTDEL